LTTAMSMEAIALRFVPPEHPGRGKSNHHMGILFQKSWEATKTPEALDQAIRHYELAVEHGAEKDLVLGCWSADVAVMLTKRFFAQVKAEDIDAAELWYDVATALVGDSPLRMVMLSNKGDFLRITPIQGIPEQGIRIAQSLVCHQQAVDLCERYLAAPSRLNLPFAMVLRNASQSHLAQFLLTGHESDIASAIATLCEAIDLQPLNEMFKVELGKAYLVRGEKLGDTSNIDKACSIWEEVVGQNPNSVDARVELGECYRKQGSQTSNRQLAAEKIDRAITLIDGAVEITLPSQGNPGFVYDRCSAAHYSKYRINGAPSDIDRAIECSRLAISYHDGPGPWNYHSLLGHLLVDRYSISKQPADLTDAFDAAEEAVRLCGETRNPSSLAECKWVFGQVLKRQYDENTDSATLRKAIDAFTEARDQMSELGSRHLLLNDLGNAYVSLFRHTSSQDYLDKGFDALKEALDILRTKYSSELHPDVLMINSSLGGIMLQRYRYWGGESDLKASESYYRKSLSGIDPSHPRYAPRAGNLSYVLRLLFELKGDTRQLQDAQDFPIKALNGPLALNGETKNWLETHVGDIFCRAYEKTKELSDLEDAINHYDNALALNDVVVTYRATTLTNRAVALKLRAEQTGSLTDFHESYQGFEQVRQMLAEDNPHAWVNLLNQARLALEMYERKIGPDYQIYGLRAFEKYRDSAKNTHFDSGPRINAASIAASLADGMLRDTNQARDLICIGLEVLSEAVFMQANRLEQLDYIRKYHFIPSSATALSLKANDSTAQVIQRLEASRATIWDRLLDDRTPVESLGNVEKDVIKKFQALQQRLTQPSSSSRNSPNAALLADLSLISPEDEKRLQRQRDGEEYKHLLRELRQLNIKTLKDSSQLQELVVDAPIVFINASQYRSDALIMSKRKVFHVTLPMFAMKSITEQASTLMLALHKLSSKDAATVSQGLADYKTVMKWLWESAAKPILESIDFSEYAHGPANKPHVKWIAAGWVTIFPIHAAGDFSDLESRSAPTCVHDLVVSSYATSLKALNFARQRAANLSNDKQKPRRGLVVAMATTPGLDNLDVDPEIQFFEEQLAKYMKIEVLRQKDAKTVKDGLKTCDLALFACHAQADWNDPSKSAILLQDCARLDQATSQITMRDPQPFCVRVILRLDLQQCRLVHLSACETGANKDLLLRDEGIHIAGGFHMAGVPHVISTLWRVTDSVSVDLTRSFYEHLKDDNGQLRVNSAADALHMAIQELRDKRVEPMLWGPFIHSGP